MCALFLAVGVSFAAAQWTPLTAGIRETTQISKDGIASQTIVREGVFLRASDGSTLTHWTKVNGEETPGTGNLLNNTTHRSFSLDYKAMTAKQGRFAMDPFTKDSYSQMVTVGNGTVAGIPCRMVPINDVYPQKTVRVGEACVFDEQGIILKEETRVTRDDGSISHVVTEKFDVRLNVKPNAAEFDAKRFAYAEVPAEKPPAMK
jgi:hypothetical protein